VAFLWYAGRRALRAALEDGESPKSIANRLFFHIPINDNGYISRKMIVNLLHYFSSQPIIPSVFIVFLVCLLGVLIMFTQIEAECVAGSLRSMSEFTPLDCVNTFTLPLARLAALESFGSSDDDDDEISDSSLIARTERGTTAEMGYKDRLQLDRDEKDTRENRVLVYREQGENNQPIDYRTDDSARMEAAMDTFIKFCDRLGDPSCPDIP
jgi:hypothetical protein